MRQRRHSVTKTDLILDMPLDQLVDLAHVDKSEQRRPALVTGLPEAVTDSDLGASTQFDGVSGLDVTLADLPAAQSKFTVSAWVNIHDIPKVEAAILTIGELPAGGLTWSLNQASELGMTVHPSGAFVKAKLPIRTWRHIAFVRNGSAFSVLVDGTSVNSFRDSAFAFNSSFLRIAAPYTPAGKVANAAAKKTGSREGFVGEIAKLRIHKKALSASSIRTMMETDRTPFAVYENENPLNLRLLDGQGDPTIYIQNDGSGRPLRMELQNVSTNTLEFKGKGKSGELKLRFPPGTLNPRIHKSVKRIVTVRESAAWSLAKPKKGADNWVELRLVPNRGVRPLLPGETSVITFDNVSAEVGEGTRVGGVLISYNALQSTGTGKKTYEPVQGERYKPINIINHSGNPFLPFAFSFGGGARVLSGANDETLTLIMRNTSADRSVTFYPQMGTGPNAKSASAIELEFTAETNKSTADSRPGALLQAGAFKGTSVSFLDPAKPRSKAPASAWFAQKKAEDSASPRWILSPSGKSITMAPGDELHVIVSGVRASEVPGHASVRLLHHHIPGFWFGEVSLSVEKSPLVFSAKGQVGIGMDPTSPLTIKGTAATAGGKLLTYTDSHGTPRWDVSVQNGDLQYRVSSSREPDLYLGAGGNVGFGTANPQGNIHIKGKKNKAAIARITSDKGQFSTLQFGVGDYPPAGVSMDGNGNASIRTLGNRLDIVTAGVGVLFATSGQLRSDNASLSWSATDVKIKGPLEVVGNTHANGKLGIGTSDPSADFHLYGGDNRATYGLLTSRYKHPSKFKFNFGSGEIGSVGIDGYGQMILATEGDRLFVGTKQRGDLYCLSGNFSEGDSRVKWDTSGVTIQPKLHVEGTLTAKVKNFAIPHPLNPDETLVHSSLEGPEAGVYYRGEGQLADGTAQIELPPYFEMLTHTKSRTVHLTAIGRKPFLLSYDEVRDGKFMVFGTEPEGRFSWEVRAVRADVETINPEPDRHGKNESGRR